MDLFFKNTPYFVSTYLDFSIWEYLVAFFVCYIVLHIFLRYVAKMSIKKAVALAFTFSLYFALLIGMTLLGDNRIGKTGMILDPLFGIKKILLENNVHFLRGMLSNVLFFVPCGLFYVIIDYRYTFLKGVLFSAFISFVLELLQYLFKVGYFETSDIICNIIGMAVGMVIAVFVKWLNKILIKKQAEE